MVDIQEYLLHFHETGRQMPGLEESKNNLQKCFGSNDAKGQEEIEMRQLLYMAMNRGLENK